MITDEGPLTRSPMQPDENDDPMLKWFKYEHLPLHLQEVSKPFCLLAEHIVEKTPRNAERTVALRKLLEAKDAGVRAHVE